MTDHSAAPTVPASIARRVGAYALDIGTAYLLIFVIGGIAGAVQLASSGGDAKALAGALLLVWAIVVLVSLAWLLVYSAMQGGRGSIGQRATGVMIRDAATGAPIGFWRALLRNVVWGLAGCIVVGYFSALFDSSGRRQGWHDLATRSVVVIRQPALAAPTVPAVPPMPAGVPSAAAPSRLADPIRPPAASAAAASPVRTIEPAAVVAAGGVISQVPGAVSVAAPASPVPPAVPAPLAPPAPQTPPAAVATTTPVPSVASPPVPVPAESGAAESGPAGPDAAEPDFDELDQTRAAASLPSSRVPDPAAIVVLTWDNGTRMAVYGRTLYGRNPETEPGAARVAVRDETLSLSKTHFELGGDAAGPWIIDRHSTNGSVLVRNGSPQRLIAGVQTTLRGGDRLEFGDRSVEVSTS